MVVGSDRGAGEGEEGGVGFEDVLVMGVGALRAGEEVGAIGEKGEPFGVVGGAIGVADAVERAVWGQGRGAERDRAVEFLPHFEAPSPVVVERDRELVRIGEIDVACFQVERVVEAGPADLAGEKVGVERGEVLLDRLERVEAGARFEGGDEVALLVAEIEEGFLGGVDFKIVGLE